MRITIVQGHPDPAGGHYGHALAQAYASGAGAAGHEVRTIAATELDFPLIRTRKEWEGELYPDSIRGAQDAIRWANHLVILYPLWLGSMPALLKGFLEQVMRPGFAFSKVEAGKPWKRLLKGRSARIVVTMGMPALAYRWYFGAHSLKSLERNILGFVGIGPIRETLIGLVESCGTARREKWLEKLHALGRAGT
ncbi:MAG: NAD(P)H-dependent oxidoreductase [Burkholderiales bacterium]